MDISFIVLSYNQSSYIDMAIKSIIYSGKYCKYEIIVCDNNSTDYSYSKLHNFTQRYNVKNLKIVNSTLHKNQSKLRNLGMKLAKGKYMFFLDMDDHFNIVPTINIIQKILSTKNCIDVILPDVVSQNRNNLSIFKLRNITLLDEPAISTCQYIVNLKFCIENNIFWEESKYCWDSEDIYFGLLILNKASTKLVIHKTYYVHFKHPNSNSDRKILSEYYKYLIYINDMYNDTIKFNKNPYYIMYFQKIIYNMYTHVKTLKSQLEYGG